MSLLERGRTRVTVFTVRMVSDGYGDHRPATGQGTTYSAWVQPVGDAAGWRAPVGAQVGWSPPVRRKIVFPPEAVIDKWSAVAFEDEGDPGTKWAVVDAPRAHHGASDRMRFVTVIVEGGGQSGRDPAGL
ncbi:hypothetical protein OH807_33640 [Kitasatospora sp. NBC_01560]|uniref:hypothetical protein n=1 Tax=unclassified Kitasatospora TaxID=2633591 RepID=UPI002E119743|nr:hypothetical protein OG294_09150 [Kitasatospora sp. NBC_01302]